MINARDAVRLEDRGGILSNVEKDAIAQGGDISITTGSLFLTNVGVLNSTTNGQGNAGNINIQASDSVVIDGGSSDSFTGIGSAVLRSGVGRGGDIQITTGSLSLANDASLLGGTGGQGDAGNVIINARDRVSFNSGATLFTNTSGQGNAGNVTIRTGDLSLDGVSQVDNSSSAISSSVYSTGVGRAGNIDITTDSLSITNGGTISATTSGKGNAGNVEINTTGDITFNNDSDVISATFGDGNAGNVTVTAGGTASFDGSQSGISTIVGAGPGFVGKRKGGNINLNSPNISITNGAALSSSSLGEGFAGDINIDSRSVRLDNQGEIVAQTISGNGGNIKLTAADFLLLRRSSQISTSGGLSQQSGDGGNITINTPFIIAIPNENSDISADAYTGRGGKVEINAQSIFGIQERSFPTPFSDITARSKLGVQGQIDITQPDVQPTQGLVELPGQILDASDQIASVCPNGNTASRPLGEFVVSGRGSLPPNPLELLPGSTSLSPLASIEGDLQANTSPQTSEPATTATPNTIVEAQGWMKTAQGKIALVAHAPQATPSATTAQATCPVGNSR